MSSQKTTWALVKVGTLKIGPLRDDGSQEYIDLAPSVLGTFEDHNEARYAAERYAAEDGSVNPIRWANRGQGRYHDWLEDPVHLRITEVSWGYPGPPWENSDAGERLMPPPDPSQDPTCDPEALRATLAFLNESNLLPDWIDPEITPGDVLIVIEHAWDGEFIDDLTKVRGR